jgi:hypothetical protein
MPGLRGFSASNLKKMRQFYTAYEHTSIGSLLTIQMQSSESEGNWSIITTESDNPILSIFLSITFIHHITLLNKCKGLEERMLYIKRAAEAYWSISVLEHH